MCVLEAESRWQFSTCITTLQDGRFGAHNELVAQTRSVRLYRRAQSHRIAILCIGLRVVLVQSSSRRGESGRRDLVGLEYSVKILWNAARGRKVPSPFRGVSQSSGVRGLRGARRRPSSETAPTSSTAHVDDDHDVPVRRRCAPSGPAACPQRQPHSRMTDRVCMSLPWGLAVRRGLLRKRAVQ